MTPASERCPVGHGDGSRRQMRDRLRHGVDLRVATEDLLSRPHRVKGSRHWGIGARLSLRAAREVGGDEGEEVLGVDEGVVVEVGVVLMWNPSNILPMTIETRRLGKTPPSQTTELVTFSQERRCNMSPPEVLLCSLRLSS